MSLLGIPLPIRRPSMKSVFSMLVTFLLVDILLAEGRNEYLGQPGQSAGWSSWISIGDDEAMHLPCMSEGEANFASSCPVRSGRLQSLLQKKVSHPPAISNLQMESLHDSQLQIRTSNDLTDLTSSLIVNTVVLGAHVTLFCILRLRLPKLYSSGWLARKTPLPPGDGMFSWIQASLTLTEGSWLQARASPEVVEAVGLDAAMMIQFQDLCIRMLIILGVPMVLIMCPLHYIYGEAAEIDPLSKIDILNLTEGSWVYWLHAFIVWIVVWAVQRMLVDAMEDFLELRHKWLRELPQLRSTTCLVQNIPEQYRTDTKLKAYVDNLLMRDSVMSAFVVRQFSEDLQAQFASIQNDKDKLRKAERAWGQDARDPCKRPSHTTDMDEEVDSIDYYGSLIHSSSEKFKQSRDVIEAAVKSGDTSQCSEIGFVTFRHRHDAELALSMRLRTSSDEIVFLMPPEPMDVRYDVLQQGSWHRRRRVATGSGLMVGLFFSYFPIVVIISLVTSLETFRHVFPIFNHVVMEYPMATSVWDGIVGSLVLVLFMSFVPTLMMLIIRNFFGLASETWCQQRMQHWYFYFQVLFVLLVFSLGNSLFTSYMRLVKNPTRLCSLLASTLPQAAHFYLKFFPIQMAAHASHICRYWNLIKFYYYKRSVGEDLAFELAEPDDADFYGMGARSARSSLLFVIALVFCSVCPLVSILAFGDFLVRRIALGYLLVFAETRKPDSGGTFWCNQLKHLQLGLFLYITLMVGILVEKAGAYGPGLVAASCYLYMIESYVNLEQLFRWSRLPFEELVASRLGEKFSKASQEGCYLQPELAAGI